MSPQNSLLVSDSHKLLNKMSLAELRTFDKNESIRSYLLTRYASMRADHPMLYRMSDEEFLTYLVEGKIIGFSIWGQITDNICLTIPPVRVIACKTALVFLDLEGRVGYLSYATGEITYLAEIVAVQILPYPHHETIINIMIKNGGQVLAVFDQGEIELIPNSIGNVRQIFGNRYVVSDENKLYRTSLRGRKIVNNLVSSNCLFAIDVMRHNNLKFMGCDGKTYFCYNFGESGLCTLARYQWIGNDFQDIFAEEEQRHLQRIMPKNMSGDVNDFFQDKMIFRKTGDELYMFSTQDTLFRSGVCLGTHIDHVTSALDRTLDHGCDFYAIKYN